MATAGEEPVGSMGTDTSLAVLSNRPRLLYDYFKQLFAQVTNPPLDGIREELVTQIATTIGPEGNLLEPTPEAARQLKLRTPILNNEEVRASVTPTSPATGRPPSRWSTPWPRAVPASRGPWRRCARRQARRCATARRT